MKLLLKRNRFYKDSTHGSLFVNGKYYCDTLEPHAIDWERESKVNGKTAIPEGTYRVAPSYSSRFKKLMPFVCEVPYFKGVMIHPGNNANDTKGCILVGEFARPGWIRNSRNTFDSLKVLIAEAYAVEDVEITIE